MSLIVGMDIGGSGTRVRAVDNGRTLGDRSGESANPAAVGLEMARNRLGELMGPLLGQRQVDAACAGAAGGDGPYAIARIEAVLRDLLPSARLRVVNDMRIVLAASGLDAGIALNAGTGSIAYGWSADARECRAGGWGHLLGDEGSAYWIAKEAIRDLLYDADRGLELRPMQRELLERSGSASPLELVHRFHENREPAQWARLAPLVFDGADRDPAAQRIVEQAAAVLGGLVETVRRRLGAELPVVLAGGLLLSMDRLREDVSRLVPGEVTVLREPPVLGAVRLAAELMR